MFRSYWVLHVTHGLKFAIRRSAHTVYLYFFFMYLSANSDYFPVQNKLTGFYNRDGECLLRGTNKYDSG